MEQIGMINNKSITGIPVVQNGQEFIIGKIKICDLIRVTKYTERVIVGYDEDEKPIYNNQVQRKVEQSRVNKIADFLINDKEATFPTNIVLGIPMNAIEEQTLHRGELIEITLTDDVFEQVASLKNNADIYITIIDGQHRVKGIEVAIERLNTEINVLERQGDTIELSKKKRALHNLLNIELVVSYFIDKSLEYQAMIFSTINRTQKRVSQDLVFSLFGLSADDTPYKTALEVVLALNGHDKSPFYKRIKLYGGNYRKGDSPPLSQATMIKNIVSLISESLRESEKDRYRKRKELLKRSNNKNLPFRMYYANNQDEKISDCLFYFFNSVKVQFPKFWNYDGISKPQNILQSTVGFEALLDLMVDIINNENINTFDNNTFMVFISRMKGIDFSNTTIFPMSTKGRKILYLSMYLAIYQNDTKKKELNELISKLNNAE